jgi:hypothetical protein
MRPAESQLQSPILEKNSQKYMGLGPEPGDEELLDQLTPKHREILRSEGQYTELAVKFGVAVGTIRSRLHRARAALSMLRKERLEAQAERSQLTDAIKVAFGEHENIPHREECAEHG